MQVVTERTPFAGGTVAINNFGFGGTNVHLLIQSGLNFAPRKSLVQQPTGTVHISSLNEINDGQYPPNFERLPKFPQTG